MKNIVPEIIILSICVGTFLSVNFVTSIIKELLAGPNKDVSLSKMLESSINKEYSWFIRLVINCIGYAAVIIPVILVSLYTKKIKYLERSGKNWISATVRSCFADVDKVDAAATAKQTAANRTILKEGILLAWCFLGLMSTYLTWGVLQEKIMTTEYLKQDGKTKVFFKDSQFLVFANRVLAFIVAGGYLLVRQQSRLRTPLYKYSFASFSNIMSAWFQYEALKFISFPTQVLAKSCKIIPVMIMGKVVSRNKYEFYEYLTALLISFGMIFFLTGSHNNDKTSAITTLTGVLLLTFYMVFDSFTSNWQSDLFKTYGISSIQMMCGVNLFSTLFTSASLFVQGGFMESLSFATEHPDFMLDCIILSISSACGQLFIFYTISKFGAVVFTIIMTVRQAIAILLSCLIYKHEISPLGVLGIVVVFLAIALRVYCSHRMRMIRRRHEGKQRLLV